MASIPLLESLIVPGFASSEPFQYYPANSFPWVEPPPPYDWLRSHFAVGGWSPIRRLSGMLTAHMTSIAPRSGFTWHPHRGLEIYTWVLEGTISHEDTTGGQGDIGPGELQRMFSGDWIEHQELNRTDKPVRVIQIWYVADFRYRDLPPHYQQLRRDELPRRQVGAATVFHLIGDGSPMEQHFEGRLTAATVEAGGTTVIEAPRTSEDLFLYVTDGAGQVACDGREYRLGQYDVILATPELAEATIRAQDEGLHFMSFYLPRFLA
jgi:hypothetical protein